MFILKINNHNYYPMKNAILIICKHLHLYREKKKKKKTWTNFFLLPKFSALIFKKLIQASSSFLFFKSWTNFFSLIKIFEFNFFKTYPSTFFTTFQLTHNPMSYFSFSFFKFLNNLRFPFGLFKIQIMLMFYLNSIDFFNYVPCSLGEKKTYTSLTIEIC